MRTLAITIIFFCTLSSFAQSTPDVERAFHPPVDVLASPQRGFNAFLNSLHAELKKHGEEIDTLSSADWDQPFYLLIPTEGSHMVDKPNKLVAYLDSSLSIPWKKSIFRGHVANELIEIRLEKRFLDEGVYNSNDPGFEFQRAFVLPKKYKDQWVRIWYLDPESRGRITVSFVLNPLTRKLENGAVLNGDPEEAGELMDWIIDLDITESVFYWAEDPDALQTFFHID